MTEKDLSLSIKGDLTAGEDLVIDCAFEGSIQLDGHDLTFAVQSKVQAAASARSVTLHGTFEGQIEAEVVIVNAGADVTATVITKKLTLKEGGLFNGSVNTERARAANEVARHRAGQRVSEAT